MASSFIRTIETFREKRPKRSGTDGNATNHDVGCIAYIGLQYLESLELHRRATRLTYSIVAHRQAGGKYKERIASISKNDLVD